MIDSKKLEELVEEYLGKTEGQCQIGSCINMCSFFDVPASLEDSINIYTRSERKFEKGSHILNGKKHTHQSSIRPVELGKLAKRLIDNIGDVQNCSNFDQLLKLVEKHSIGLIRVGELSVYDTALRLGYCKLNIEPDFVYLHAGAKKGAQYLGVKGKKVSLDRFPPAMHKLSCMLAEDFLCVMKNRIAELSMPPKQPS